MNLTNRIVKSLSNIHQGWKDIFDAHRDDLKNGLEVLKKVDASKITPTIELIFATFIINPEDVKVIIIGQDPYPGISKDGKRRDACGLSFSCDGDEPKSFTNIKKCLMRQGYDIQSSDLRSWLYQGVMLLNMALTTEVSVRGAHKDYWKKFVTSVIIELTTLKDGIHFLLWGRDAQSVKDIIKGKQHIHQWTHPSPLIDNTLSIEKRFVNCDNFDELKNIDWSTKKQIMIYTDGASKLHKEASYAVYTPGILRLYGLIKDQEYLLIDNQIITKDDTSCLPTSQRGEYIALAYALLIVTKLHMNNVIIITDSANGRGLITEWTKRTEKYLNSDIVYIMRALYNSLKDQVEIVHTLSHGKDKTSPYNEGNNMVDKIAVYALKKMTDYDTHIDYQDVELSL